MSKWFSEHYKANRKLLRKVKRIIEENSLSMQNYRTEAIIYGGVVIGWTYSASIFYKNYKYYIEATDDSLKLSVLLLGVETIFEFDGFWKLSPRIYYQDKEFGLFGLELLHHFAEISEEKEYYSVTS